MDFKIEDCRNFAQEMAKTAGDIMRKNFMLGMKKEWKADHSPVTESDIQINKILIEEVKKQFPSFGIIAEEESALNPDAEYNWVCDPVDGTIPFSVGVPISVFGLALVKKGKSILGIIRDPFEDRTFYAEEGQGTTLNGEKICVSNSETLIHSLLNIENFEAATYPLWDLAKELGIKGVKTTKYCSIMYPSALVASGEFVATIFVHHTCHDIAPVKIIVEEAGGKVTDLWGNDQRYDQPIKGAIASNGKVHDELVKMTAKYLK